MVPDNGEVPLIHDRTDRPWLPGGPNGPSLWTVAHAGGCGSSSDARRPSCRSGSAGGGGGAAAGEEEPAGLGLGGGRRVSRRNSGVASGTSERRAGFFFGCGSGQSGGGEAGAWVLAAGASPISVSGCGAGDDMAWGGGSATSSFASATLVRLASLAGDRPGEAGGLVLQAISDVLAGFLPDSTPTR